MPVFQKAVFGLVKDGLLEREKPSFISRKAAFRNYASQHLNRITKDAFIYKGISKQQSDSDRNP